MPLFPSQEWCAALVASLQSDPDYQQAAKGWEGDFAVVVLAEPPMLNDSVFIYARPLQGIIGEILILDTLEALEAKKPAYKARANYSTWKGLLLGQVTPIEAVIKKDLEIQGDLQPIIDRVQFSDLLKRAVERVPTEFADSNSPPNRKATLAMDELKNQAVEWIGKMLEQALSDDRRAAKVAEAVSAVNRGRTTLEQAQESLMRTLGVAGKREFREMGSRVASLKRRVKSLSEKIPEK